MSKNNPNSFTAHPFPRMRQLVLDAGWMGKRQHMMHGFIEVDVTKPRRLIEERAERDGRKLSFSAFVLACIGQAVAHDKRVHAMRDWRNRFIIFDEVDVLMSIEIPAGDSTFPLVHPIRAVSGRTPDDIHDEIRAIQARPEQSKGMQSPLIRWFHWLPSLSGVGLMNEEKETTPSMPTAVNENQPIIRAICVIRCYF
jgi:hypothetical protein